MNGQTESGSVARLSIRGSLRQTFEEHSVSRQLQQLWNHYRSVLHEQFLIAGQRLGGTEFLAIEVPTVQTNAGVPSRLVVNQRGDAGAKDMVPSGQSTRIPRGSFAL